MYSISGISESIHNHVAAYDDIEFWASSCDEISSEKQAMQS